MLGLELAIEGNFDPQPSQVCGDWRRKLPPNEAKRMDTMCFTTDWHTLQHAHRQHPMLPSFLVLPGDAVGDVLATQKTCHAALRDLRRTRAPLKKSGG